MLNSVIMRARRRRTPPEISGGSRSLSHRREKAGFTLVEVMVAVAIIGVLATLGIAGLRRHALQSNVAGGIVVVKSIAAAEEQYRALNQVYYDVPEPSQWYPSLPGPNQKRSFWMAARGGGDAMSNDWYRLAPDVRQPVEFQFRADAGNPNPDPQPLLATTAIGLPPVTPNEQWYIVQARADADGDSVFAYIAAASWTPQVVTVEDGE